MESDTHILGTKTGLEKRKDRVKQFLANANGFLFWNKHFANHNFQFKPGKFSWDYWRTIPFFYKEDFLRIGLSARMADAKINAGANLYNFILRMTSGTSGLTEPIAVLRPINGRVFPKGEERTVWTHDAYVIGLLGTLLHIDANRLANTNRYQMLLLNPFRVGASAAATMNDFKADSVSAFPAVLARLASLMLENKIPAPASIKKVILSGDFLHNSQRALIEQIFRNPKIELGYGLGEFGKIGNPCIFLAPKYGLNAFHPIQYKRLIELADIDENGYGEIIATSLGDPAICLIRYRTGDMARALQEKCECGANFTLILAGRKNFDYIKCAGAMLVRQELERVLKTLTEYIEEWRAEAREALNNTRIVGELTLKIKPTSQYDSLTNPEEFIRSKIEKTLFLTPTHTLANLISSGAFSSLKIERVENFPQTKKPLLLRRVD